MLREVWMRTLANKALDRIRKLEEERDFACWCCYKCTLFHFNTIKYRIRPLVYTFFFLQHLPWNQLKQTNRSSRHWWLLFLQPLCYILYGFSCVNHYFPHNSDWLLPEGQQVRDIKKGQTSGCPQPLVISRKSHYYSMEASTKRNPKMAREKHKVLKHLILSFLNFENSSSF